MSLRGLYYHFWTHRVTRPIHEKIHEDFLSRVSVERGARVLDIGCGTGFYSQFFKDVDYTGIDLSDACIREASRRHTGKFLCRNAASTGFPGGSFEVIFCANVIHHLDDRTFADMLKEARRIAAPDAQIVLYDVYRKPGQPWPTRLAYALDFGGYVRPLDEIKKILEASGMQFSLSFSRMSVYDYYCALIRP